MDILMDAGRILEGDFLLFLSFAYDNYGNVCALPVYEIYL